MRILTILLFVMLALEVNSSCSMQTKQDKSTATVAKSDHVEVYYFHFTRRCATCNAVEQVSKEALTELYGKEVTFTSYNLDEENGKAKGNELGVSGQSLLIVAGENTINLTTEGFMNARSNPDKLKAIIKGKIDPLL